MMNHVLADEVWSFFCTRLPQNKAVKEEQRIMFSEIEWDVQIDELNSKLVRSTVTRCDKNEVAVRIPLMTQIFELTIRKSENFPEETPIFDGEFIEGFQTFEWNSESTLLELTEKITDYCITIDIAILEIKEAETDGFQMTKLEIDEEEVGHILVQMRATKYKETLTLSLDIEDFRSFPRILRCSNPLRTSSFDCEKWSVDDKMGNNLRKLYGEMEVQATIGRTAERDERIDVDSYEDETGIMDFI
ncbi:unnamed protein product [Caenorhabditis brenneri]